MILPSRIESSRLVLLPVQFTDATELNQAIREALPGLAPWLRWAEPTHALRDTQQRIQLAVAGAREQREVLYMLRTKTGRLVGEIHVLAVADALGRQVPAFRLIPWLRPSEARKGYGTEALRALVEALQREAGARRLDVWADAGNTALAAMLAKAGLKEEARLRHTTRSTPDNPGDTLVFSVVS